MTPGQRITGPAIIVETTGTVVVENGWRAELNNRRHLILERYKARPKTEAIGTKADPVMLEVFNNLFMSIAEQMGGTLSNTAYSVNIKERLDFSCAVFDPEGNLEKTIKKEHFGEDAFYHDVFNAEGRYIAKIPIRVNLDRNSVWKHQRLYTIETDNEDFQVVKRYRVVWKIRPL